MARTAWRCCRAARICHGGFANPTGASAAPSTAVRTATSPTAHTAIGPTAVTGSIAPPGYVYVPDAKIVTIDGSNQGMIRKSGNRFSEKIMPNKRKAGSA